MIPKLEIRVVFCRFGVGGLPNVVERRVFQGVVEAVEYLRTKEVSV